MNRIWTEKWKKVLLWLCGYASIVAYAIVGGYTIVKSESDSLKKTAKDALCVTLFFTAASALVSLLTYVGQMFDYYNSDFYEAVSIIGNIVSIVRIIVFALLIIAELVRKDGGCETVSSSSSRSTENAENVETASIPENGNDSENEESDGKA